MEMEMLGEGADDWEARYQRRLDGLALFWKDPTTLIRGDQIPEKIEGGPFDQEVPEGVLNPYWEIVRRLPLTQLGLPWEGRPEPDPYVMADGYVVMSRDQLTRNYAWSIPSPGDIAWMIKHLNGRGLVELGAGAAYWAWQLRQAGADVIPYEPFSPSRNRYAPGKRWTPIKRGDHLRIKDHPDRSLLISWPGYGSSWAEEALVNYAGDQFFYAGEGEGGCCADDGFFRTLEDQWEMVENSPHHISFWGIHCYLEVYQRASGH